jgi:GAF domain-containing protein
MTSRSELATSLAEAARTIHTGHSLEETLDAIARAARVSVPGIDHAGISTMECGGRIVTRASTDQMVRDLDDLQYSLNEGPCVDALRDELVVAAPHIRYDQRWPSYVAEAVLRTGLKSQLAIRLFLDDTGTLGGLNLYSTETEDIEPEAESVAELFAVHAAIALGQAQESENLTLALGTRKVIGQAIGIVMERYGMHEDRAFAFLARASSHGNIKLRDVAQQLVDQVNDR